MSTKHAFISYVHEDAERVDSLQVALEAAGIRVWRDKDQLFPGSDWATEISEAIKTGSLAFIACFSEASHSRGSSYQYEELTLAIDQFRQLPPDRMWLFPVRFDDVPMPRYSLGANRTFDSIHRTDLFGERHYGNLVKLITSLSKLVGEGPTAKFVKAPTNKSEALNIRVKQILREPSLEIELEDLVTQAASRVSEELQEDRFSADLSRPQSDEEALSLMAERLTAYEEVLRPLAEVFVVGGAWGEQKHGPLWSRALGLIINSRREAGKKRLLELQEFIPLYLIYAFTMAATVRENYYGLNELLLTSRRSLDSKQPMIERLHTGAVFESAESGLPTLVVLRAQGTIPEGKAPRKLAPVSDYLFYVLRPLLKSLVPDERDYAEAFDQTEILLALRAKAAKQDADASRRYAYGPWFGRHTWKMRHVGQSPVDELLQKYSEQSSEWKPLKQGLFKSSSQLDELFPIFRDEVQDTAMRRGY